MSQHTLEPWCRDCSEEWEAGVRDNRGVKLCPLHAAAEKLLAALETLMLMDVKGHALQDRLQFSTAGRAILERARAAIAKAKP
jgi:hypothetical protein